ncbi:hypothetical protein JCM8202_002317 [Rhodotorula sphaerocarpa]
MGAPSPTRQHSRSSSHFASNLILSPVSGTAPQLPSAADSPAADASRRPKAGEHVQRRRSAPFGSDLIREPPSPPPWQTEPRGREGEGEAPGDDDGSRTPSLPPTDPSTPAQSSFPSTSNSLAQFIQTKRRQASAPYFASARSQSLFSPGAGFSLGRDSSDAVSSPQTTTATTSDLPAAAPRNRSRASSRRATATGGLPQLRTQGLESFAQIAQHDAGLVPTPTIEEWRQLGSDLADMRMKAEQEEQEQGAGGEARHASPPRPKPKWKRWPSLHDDSDDSDDEGESSGGDQAEDFRLSLSLSALGQHQLPHTPPPGAGPEAPKKSYKSSFAYSSSGFGSTGGFVSHSNTRSLGGLSSASSPEPDSAQGVFEPTHDGAGQKGDPTLALSTTEVNVQSMTHLSRPSLSRGSLSTATGGLSTPSPPRSGDSETETGSVGSVPPPATAVAAAEETTQKPRDGLPRVPLPPRVYRSLETGEPGSSTSSTSATSSTTSLSDDVFPSGAPTPFDGDPFASSAPAGTAVPPTPHFGEHVPGGEPPEGAPHPQRDGAGTGDVQAVDLDWTKPLGPVDPRTYSAVTGLRDIRSFVCEEEEAGKGAYGSVRRARERGPDGKPVGPELIIKYVIKQRILADCWKKHKILGPIPIEVHVLDHLRRVPYETRPPLNYVARRRNGSSNRFKMQPVRRDSAPQLDLWHGGKDGGSIQTGHPSICPLLDYWEDSEFYFLVMPQATAAATPDPSASGFRRGQDLFDYVDAHPDGLPLRDISSVLSQVADALWFLHEHSIVHRDIKDENVAMDPTGLVRLIDFGSAAYVKETRKFDTFSGTLDFAAPEVLKGARYGGKEQDIWALGVLGYVLVCGECPFWSPDEAIQGISPETRAYAALQAKADASATGAESQQQSSIRDAVDLVMRCLEIDPQNRPTADMVCDHVFFVGAADGWSGGRGWECE